MSTVNSSTIGVNLGNSDGATALFGLGNTITGSDGSQWIYAYATSALVTGTVCAVTTAYVAQGATTSNLMGSAALGAGTPNNGETLAFAQGTWAAADYGWLCIRGSNQYVRISSISTYGVALYIADGASGVLTSYAATSGTMAGVVLLTASSTAVQSAVKSYLQYPRLQAGGTLGV
jgi:hypothetical protein